MGEPTTGVIHDIGYRSYDGQRLGRAYLVRSLYVQSLRGAFGLGRPAKALVMPMFLLAAMVVPAFILVVVSVMTGATEYELEYYEYVPVTFYISAIFLAAQAPQLVSRDLRFQVVPLYFSRPLSRADYVLAKYAAMATALLILLAAPLLVMYGGGLLTGMPFWAQTRGVAKGLLGVVLFALVLAAFGLVVASATPRRGFGVAAIITGILISYTLVVTVQAIALEVSNNQTVALYAELFTPYNLVNGLQLWILGVDQNPQFSDLTAPHGWQGVVFAVVAAAVVAVSAAFLLLRYRKAGAR